MKLNKTSKCKEDVSIGKNAIVLTIAKLFATVITMLITMLLARIRTLEEYGTYSQILLVINLTTTLFMLGLPSSINYFLARAEQKEDRKNFLSVFYSLSTILCFVMGIALVSILPLIVRYFNNDNIIHFAYFIALYPWACVISSTVENVLIVYQKTSFLIIYRLLYGVCLLGTVLVIAILNLGFSEYMFGFLAVNCIFAISVYCISAHLSGGLKFSLDKNIIKEILVFSLPLGIASMIGTLNVEVDKLLIGWLMNTEELAIYTNASKELPVTIISTSITAVLLPRLTVILKKNKNEDAIRLWHIATELSCIFMSLVVAGIFTYAEEVMIILYSEKYLSGINVFRVYTLVLLVRITYFGMILNAKGESKKILYSSIMSLALNIVMNPIFYYLFGMVGPALATFFSMTIILILQLKWTSKIVKIPFKSIFPWKNCFNILIINVVFSIVFKLIKNFSMLEKYISEVGESLVFGIVWGMLYLLVMNKCIKKMWGDLNAPMEEE